MSYCEAHSYQHEIVSGCPRCLDNKRCLQIGDLVMDEEVKDAEIARLREALEVSKHFLVNALSYGAILEHDRPKAEYTLRHANKALEATK